MAVDTRIPPRAGHLQSAVHNTDEITARRPRWFRPIIVLLTPLLIVLSIIIIWLTVFVSWWQGVNDQWNYGNSRITQMDANVGHSGNCHFIAEYYKGAIVIIEIPFANPSATHTYTIPGIATDGSTPVILLSIAKDTQTHRLNLVVRVAGTNYEKVLYNDGTMFTQG